MSVCVSIIIPIYNSEKFLDETIQSVLSQAYKNWELILVDDGSVDTSRNICEKYLYDRRIQLVCQENKGVSVARNKGLLYASGEYIFFMDSDDTIDEDFLTTSFEVAIKEDSDIVVVGEYFKRRFPNIYALPTCAMFIKHSFLKQYPEIRFPEGIQPCEDGLFSHQLLALTNKVGFNPKGIYHYRQHQYQNHIAIHQNIQKVVEKIPVWLHILEEFYQKKQLFEKKSLHLALFLEHEPFEFRYLNSNLNDVQKEFLHQLILDFYKKNIASHLKDNHLLSKVFRRFLASKNHTDFDTWYSRYLKIRKYQKKILMFLVNFIFIKKLRKKYRNKIINTFE